jgi:hypothetical protein
MWKFIALAAVIALIYFSYKANQYRVAYNSSVASSNPDANALKMRNMFGVGVGVTFLLLVFCVVQLVKSSKQKGTSNASKIYIFKNMFKDDINGAKEVLKSLYIIKYRYEIGLSDDDANKMQKKQKIENVIEFCNRFNSLRYISTEIETQSRIVCDYLNQTNFAEPVTRLTSLLM